MDYPLWNNDCADTIHAWDHANATGRYQFPAISISGGTDDNRAITLSPAGFNWTIFDTVDRQGYSPTNFLNNQFFWLHSLQAHQPASEPLKGCVYGLQGIPSNLVRKGQDDSGDCSIMLDEECVEEIKTLFSGSGTVDDEICQPPSTLSLPKCKKYDPGGSEDGSFWAVTVSRDIQLGPRPEFANCSGADGLPLPLIQTGTGLIYGDSSANNFTYYDEEVMNVTPLILSFFNNPNSSARFYQQTEMLCLRAKNITAGSRVPEKIAGRASVANLGRMTAAAVALVSWAISFLL